MSDNVAHALSGAGGGILAMLLTYPLVNVSMRSSVQAKQANGKAVSQLDVARKVIKEEGIGGLYRLLGLEALRSLDTEDLTLDCSFTFVWTRS